MFSGKLIIVLMVLGAAAAKHKSDSFGEFEACSVHVDEDCPPQNFPTINQLFNNHEIRDLESGLRVVRQLQLEDACRDFRAGVECVRGSFSDLAGRCKQPFVQRELKMIERVRGIIDYLCTDEIENIETHRDCFTDNMLVFKGMMCANRMERRRECNPEELIQCISAGIDQTTVCKEGAKEVFERIATRLNSELKPCGEHREGPGGPSASIFNFFK